MIYRLKRGEITNLLGVVKLDSKREHHQGAGGGYLGGQQTEQKGSGNAGQASLVVSSKSSCWLCLGGTRNGVLSLRQVNGHLSKNYGLD